MVVTGRKLTAAVEDYLDDLRKIRTSGGGTAETSYYPPLTNLLNAVGGVLKPKVFCINQVAEQGAGHPDLGLFAANQVLKGQPKQGQGQKPERGVVEVKPASDDAWLTADSTQVSRYWGLYRLVLVTNTRDFVQLGEDVHGQPAKLETFRLAGSAADFEAKLQYPRTFARSIGPALAEYLGRALSHRATLAEPRDLARLLASYARDGLAQVEASGEASSLNAVRSALEEALGVRFEGERARPSSAPRWCRLSSTASSPPGCCGRGRPRLRQGSSTGAPPSGTCAPPSCRLCFSRLPAPDSCSRWTWWRC